MTAGTDRLAQALGMPAPGKRPALRVVGRDEQPQGPDTHGVWRPTSTDDVVGQQRAVMTIRMHVQAACNEGRQPGAIMLSGPPGLGKTSLAGVLAASISEHRETPVKVVSVVASAVNHVRLIAAELSKLERGDVFFVDEAHALSLKVQELLGLAIEDGVITVQGTQTGSQGSMRVELPPFTAVLATTKPGHVSRPLRDRMAQRIALEYYSEDELAEIVRRAAARRGIELTDDAADTIALVGRHTPRVALSIFGHVVDYVSTLRTAGLLPNGAIDDEMTMLALEHAGIDSAGLDERDRYYLTTIHEHGQGRRIGLKPLCAITGLDAREIEDDIEPYLLRAGVLSMSPRGRCLTKAAYLHLWPDRPVPALLGLSG